MRGTNNGTGGGSKREMVSRVGVTGTGFFSKQHGLDIRKDAGKMNACDEGDDVAAQSPEWAWRVHGKSWGPAWLDCHSNTGLYT